MTTNSRQKGKTGELEVAKILREFGYEDARRGQQYCGTSGDADVVGVPGIHIEVKRRERMDLTSWYQQSCDDANFDEVPVVVHRKSREKWMVSLSFEDFLMLLSASERLRDNGVS